MSLYVYEGTWVKTLVVMCPHTVKPGLSGTNVSCLFFPFCLDLFQRLRLSGRMSALRTRPSPRTLDVISSTWSLHYLLSSTMLPSHRTATWNAWLASSLKPSWNCVLKRRRLFLLSSVSSHVCRSQKKIPPLLLIRRENKQGHPLAVCLPFTDCITFLEVTESNTATQLHKFNSSGKKSVELPLLFPYSNFLAFNSFILFSESLNCRFTHLNNSKKMDAS